MTAAPVAVVAKSPTNSSAAPATLHQQASVEMRQVFSGDARRSLAADPSQPHPLHTQWTLWFDYAAKRTSASSWYANLKAIYTVESVEKFWGVFNNIVRGSDLPHGSNYHMFRRGVKPAWEDAANKRGGKWNLNFPSAMRDSLDEKWLYTVLACIGETFEHSEEITGCVFSARSRGSRLAIWTANAANKDACMAIGRQWKQILGLPENVEFEYHSHEASASQDKKTFDPLYKV